MNGLKIALLLSLPLAISAEKCGNCDRFPECQDQDAAACVQACTEQCAALPELQLFDAAQAGDATRATVVITAQDASDAAWAVIKESTVAVAGAEPTEQTDRSMTYIVDRYDRDEVAWMALLAEIESYVEQVTTAVKGHEVHAEVTVACTVTKE